MVLNFEDGCSTNIIKKDPGTEREVNRASSGVTDAAGADFEERVRTFCFDARRISRLTLLGLK